MDIQLSRSKIGAALTEVDIRREREQEGWGNLELRRGQVYIGKHSQQRQMGNVQTGSYPAFDFCSMCLKTHFERQAFV